MPFSLPRRLIPMSTSKSLILLFFVSLPALFASYSNAYPLSSKNRWIIDESTGQREKLVCANLAGHLQPMIPEGLDKRPLKDLVAEVVKHKFNCVRLTHAIYMWTRYGDHNVEKTLKTLDIPEVLENVRKNNPSLLKMSHVEAFEAVVNEFGAQKVRVLVDNHVSEPKWCCHDDDENGFFHDRHFDPQEWIQGLSLAARRFNNNSAVVAMSLRNELHGPRQNERDWYHYMSQAAMAVHKANPQVLVVISGLNYDTELQFLRRKPMDINLGKKMVFETHLYSWSGIDTLKLREIWVKQPVNRICAHNIKALDKRAGFLAAGKNAVPLIFTEFGMDERGINEADNMFLTCLQTYLVERDMDWAIWALQGSYYLREDQVSLEETFGLLDASWKNLRYPNFTDKFQLLQRKNQDPSSKFPISSILYHPETGKCVQVNHKNELEVGSCESKDRWIHAADGGQIILIGSKKCLVSASEGNPVIVSHDCQSQSSSWKYESLSKLHLATASGDLCLQKDSNSNSIVAAKCTCIKDDSTCLEDPRSQWFQFVNTNL